MGLNYPNISDKYFADKTQPGSDIFIHGACVSVGCISITDDKIKELYTLANQATKNGQQNIRIDIFPFKFNIGNKNILSQHTDYQQHQTFWKNLKNIYTDFEKSNRLNPVDVTANGSYYIVKDAIDHE